MKKLFIFLYVLILATGALGTSIRPADQITIATRTIYNDGNVAQPDSIRIQVLRNGTELSDAWYNTADAECSANGGWLIFTDQLQDIDGAGGDGHYVILGRAYDLDSSLYTPWVYNFDVGIWTSVDNIEDSLESQDGWVGTSANQTVIIDTTNAIIDSLQSQDGWVATATNLTLAIDSINAILDTVQNQDDWIATATALTNAIDSINAVLDSIQAGFASRSVIGDTNQVDLSNYDGATPFVPGTDSVIVDVSSAQEGLIPVTIDSTWNAGTRTLTALGFTLDSLDVDDSTFIAALFATNFWAELANRADSGSVVWNTTQRDSVLAALADAGFKALIQEVLDTLQVYDNAGRFQALIASYLDIAVSSRSVAGDEMDLIEGAVDSVALALTFLYEFWAYNDSAAIDLDNALSTWMQNNLAGGAGAGADSGAVYGAVVQVLEDSTSKYQGSASGLTATEIADTLGNRGVTTGNGQYYDTLIVLNTIDSTAIANMGFDVLPLDGGTPLARVTTDLNGISVARLEAGSLSVRLIFQGYTFNTKDTLVIAGSQTDTLWGTGVVLPAPPADMVTIVMGLITANFDTLNPSYVYWRPVKSTGKAYKKSDELYYGTGVNALAIQKDWTIETSSTSTFSFSVFANANLSDTLSQYEFWLYWADGRITQKITAVPDQASFNPIGQ